MSILDLGILKKNTTHSDSFRKRYSVTIENSPYSFDVNSFDCSFGFARSGDLSYEQLTQKYAMNRIEGLFAIVIPAGGGKTSLADKFYQLDVDQVLPDHAERYLRQMRLEIYSGIKEKGGSRSAWIRHNMMWSRYLSLALGNYDFSILPRILFIHSHEVALAVGASVIGVLIPTEELHDKWLSGRETLAKEMSILNRQMLIKYTSDLPNMHFYSSELILERIVSDISAVHIGYCPYISRFLSFVEVEELIKKAGFEPGLPTNIIKENYEYGDLDNIVEWCKKGKIPWWHVTSWCKSFAPGLLADGAYSMEAYPWLRLNYEIQVLVRNKFVPGQVAKSMIKSNLDWFGIYPYVDLLTQTRGGVTLRSVFKHLPTSSIDNELITILNTHVGAHHSFVVSIVCYYLGVVKNLRVELRNKVIDSNMLLVPEEQWVSIHTELHKWVRASQSFFGMDLDDKEYALLQYTAGLYGRRNYKLDPQSEIEKRQKPRLVSKCMVTCDGRNTESYISDFKDGVRLAYTKLGSKGKDRWYNFEDFFHNRYQWAAGGSVTNLPEGMKSLRDTCDVVVEIKEQIIHHSVDSNKKRAMERIKNPAELALYLSDNWAYNVTSLAPKPNEPAKNRVLMPGSFLHYVAMSYILGMVERTGDVGSVRVGDPDDNNISHFDMRMAESTYNFMLDFADHNAQHSGLEMALIISLLEEKFTSKCDSEDLNFFINWVVDSFSNMRVRVGPNTHEVISGLFTGWRGTTWINSVACQAYVHVGMEACRRRFGAIEVTYFEGAGDDVLMKFGSAKDAFRFYECMKDCGFDMQSVKQMASHRKTEFLRTISTSGHLACCINRVLPNFISGDLERTGENMLDRLGGCYATIKMLERRGLSKEVSKILYDSYLDKWARVKIDGVYMDVSRKYLHASTEQGGLGLPDSNDCLWHLSSKIEVRREKPKLVSCDNNASRDYSQVIKKELLDKGLHLHTLRFTDRLSEDVYAMQGEVDSTDITQVLPRVVALIPPGKTYDLEMLHEVLSNVNDDKVKGYKKQWGLYSRYKQALNCLEESPDVAVKSLGISIDILEVERLKFPANHCFLIPEYLLYNIGIYFRSRVAYGDLTVPEAEHYFSVACVTAKYQFDNDLKL